MAWRKPRAERWISDHVLVFDMPPTGGQKHDVAINAGKISVMETLRLYRFLNSRRGIQALEERRLRIGRIEELNDDFEFIGVALDLKSDRVALRAMRKHIDVNHGVICMSDSWESPLMWAHYADSNRGMALGFDVPAKAFYPVEYVDVRPTLASLQLNTFGDITPEEIKRLSRLKAKGWSYEREYRAFLKLEDGVEAEGGIQYYVPFNENLKLREVIVGSRYSGLRQDILEQVDDPTVDVFMSRGDFSDFKVVKQNQASMWR